MFQTIALIVVLLIVVAVAVVLILAARKPDEFQVRRAATIKAPPQRIFDLINDFHRWAGWSPWEKKDPAMQRTFSGAAGGKGAAYEWDGNKNVGKGRMEIIESTPPSIDCTAAIRDSRIPVRFMRAAGTGHDRHCRHHRATSHAPLRSVLAGPDRLCEAVCRWSRI